MLGCHDAFPQPDGTHQVAVGADGGNVWVQERDMLRHKLQEEVEQTRAYKAALQEAAAIIAQHDWQAVLRKPHP